MKNFAVLLFLCLIVSVSFAQKKNGTVYNEHETIDKTKALWEAIQAGDKEKVKSFFADSMMVIRNGNDWETTSEVFASNSDWWKENFDNFEVNDAPGAYPDAIEYGDGNIWVQDWLMLTGTHKETGINLDLHLHNLYAFNDDGKIETYVQYYNNDVFEDIRDAETTKENGKIFINHPYIATVRKLVNAYCAEEKVKMLSFYSDNARFTNTAMDMQESIGKEERAKSLDENFAAMDNIKMSQVGYPDCIYYAQGNDYTVYSWWEYSFTLAESGKKVTMPIMLSHTFNDDGKIVMEMAYYSTNHLDD